MKCPTCRGTRHAGVGAGCQDCYSTGERPPVTDQDRAELCDALTAIARDMRRAANRMHRMGGLYREHGRELAGAAMLAASWIDEIAAQARGAGE
jgi:hypothetical protein